MDRDGDAALPRLNPASSAELVSEIVESLQRLGFGHLDIHSQNSGSRTSSVALKSQVRPLGIVEGCLLLQ
eukprot:ANDGO_07113.mRNA.1 hypothetical protein